MIPHATDTGLPVLSPSIETDAELLLLSSDFMKAQFGMEVEAAESAADRVTIRTTGAKFVFDSAAGVLSIGQRLIRERPVACVTFPPKCLENLKIEGRESGAALLSARNGKLQMRVNGDSLLMIRDSEPLTLAWKAEFAPACVRQYAGNVMLLDEYGGIGAFFATGPLNRFGGVGGHPSTGLEAVAVSGYPTVSHELTPGQILWITVAPPKPYPWDQSLRDRVVWHWSKESGYPSDSQIEDWRRYGNILLQQSEVMLWKDWMLRFIPRNGIEEFERVVRTCRRFGMRNIVYTSPFYFLAGTDMEDKAINSHDQTYVEPFTPTGLGQNWPLFLSEIRRVMREYRPSGLYFDGMYNNIVRTYLLARKAREVVGDSGLLEFHATSNQGPSPCAPPGGGMNLPQIDAYFDFLLRGEGQHADYANPSFLRYSVSTWNISNTIGVLCNNYNHKFDAAFIGKLLDNNIRLHFLVLEWANDERKDLMEKHYWPKLNDSLKPDASSP